jgi:hypothetical protein
VSISTVVLSRLLTEAVAPISAVPVVTDRMQLHL